MTAKIKLLAEKLHELGFTPQQARLYVAGLQRGASLMKPLASCAGVKRSTAYYAIEELLRRGFFSAKKIGKRTYYTAAAPEQLKKMSLQRLRFVEKISPALKRLQHPSTKIDKRQK